MSVPTWSFLLLPVCNFFPVSPIRLIKTLTKLCKQSYTSQEILNKIFKKLDDFKGQNRHLGDDASMVVFQLK